jgi:RNA polymerase sigma-70 factor (ECF subfamily)
MMMLRLVRSPDPAGTRGAATQGEQADPLRAVAARALAGDGPSQRTLLVALGPALLRVVRSVLGTRDPDAEDVLQESMLALCSALPSFRGDCQTSHFACRVAVQTAMNARRRAAHRQRTTPNIPPDDLAEVAHDGLSPADALAAARRREVLRALLEELPPVQAEVLALHTMLGHSVAETAAVTGVPVNTVRSRLRAALAALRERASADAVLVDTAGGVS